MQEPAITPMQRFQALDARDAALRSSKCYDICVEIMIVLSFLNIYIHLRNQHSVVFVII